MKLIHFLFIPMLGILGIKAYGEDSGICSQIEPALFAISDAGKVTISDTVKRKSQYSYTVGDRSIEFSTRVKLGGLTEAIDLDSDRKATTVRSLEVSGVVVSGGGSFSTYRPVEMHLGYRNGKCYVKDIFKDKKLFASSEMCKELRDQLKGADVCAKQCSDAAQSKVLQIIERHGGDAKGIEKINSVFSIQLPATAQASIYLDRCASNRALASSVVSEELWKASNDGHGENSNTDGDKSKTAR